MICVEKTCFEAIVGCTFTCLVKYYNQMMSRHHEYVWLVNSFWGLDKPVCLPPNVHLTGPLSKTTAPYMEQL